MAQNNANGQIQGVEQSCESIFQTSTKHRRSRPHNVEERPVSLGCGFVTGIGMFDDGGRA
jgi:hypothetical protein